MPVGTCIGCTSAPRRAYIMCMYMPVHMYIHVSAHMPGHMPVHLSTHMSIHMPVQISLHMPEHMSIHMFIHMSVHISVHMFIHISTCQCTCLYTCLYTSSVHMSLHSSAFFYYCPSPPFTILGRSANKKKTENVAAGSVVAQETSKSKERVQERIEKVRLTALHRPPPTGCILARASTP